MANDNQGEGMLQVDMSDWQDKKTDDKKIGNYEHFVPYRLCQKMFHRIRLTQNYCYSCKRGICEGEHGMWFGKGNKLVPVCVNCWAKENS